MALTITALAVQEFRVVGEEQTVRAWRNVEAAQKRAETSLSTFLRQARRVIGATIAFAAFIAVVRTLGKALGGLVSVPAQFEIIEQQIKRLTGSAREAAETMQFLVRESLLTPFELEDIMEAVVVMRAFNLDVQKFLPSVLDWAAALNRGVQDMAQAFGKVAAGSKQIARLLPTRGIELRTFNKAIGETANRAEALALIIERRFGGMRIIMAETFKGLMSNIHEAIAFIQRQLGQRAFEYIKMRVKQVFDYLTEQVLGNEEKLKAWADKILDAVITIEIVVKRVGAAIAFMWNTLVDALNQIPRVVARGGALALLLSMFRRIGAAALVVATAIAAVHDALQGKMLPAISTLLGGPFQALNELLSGLTSKTLPELSNWFQENAKIWEQLRAMGPQGSALVSLFQGIFDVVSSFVTGDFGGQIADDLKLARAELEQFLMLWQSPAVNVAEEAITGFMGAVNRALLNLMENIETGVWDQAVRGMMNGFISAFQTMTMSIVKNIHDLGDAIEAFFVQVADAIIRELARVAASQIVLGILGLITDIASISAGIPPIGVPNLGVGMAPYAGMGGPVDFPRSSGMQVIIQGDVYGWDDFRRKVDQANRDNTRGLVG